MEDPLLLKPEHAKISVYLNLGGGRVRFVAASLEGDQALQPIIRGWLVPLKDLGVTVLTMRPTFSSDYVGCDHVGIPVVDVYPGPD